jgi:ABC-type amino acid transport substrate-binding protein
MIRGIIMISFLLWTPLTAAKAPVSCSHLFDVSGYPDVEKVLRRKTLRVASSGDYPPFSYRVKSEMTGLDIEIINQFAQNLGVTVEFIEFRWPELMDRLREGEIDMVMSGITITPARMEVAIFSSAYVHSGAIPVVLRGSGITNIEEINNPGVTLYVNKGGYLESVAREKFPRSQIVLISDNENLGGYLTDSNHVILTDSVEVHSILSAFPNFRQLSQITSSDHAAMFPSSRVGLKQLFDEYLDTIEKSGELTRMKTRHGI